MHNRGFGCEGSPSRQALLGHQTTNKQQAKLTPPDSRPEVVPPPPMSSNRTVTWRGLPTTLAADESSGGVPVKMVFERHIVWPDGRREVEGAPKSLPAPDPCATD